MVDEYQDTNHAQYLIIKSLAARFENLCVVGDDAQSIYSFRGANIHNIFNFRRDYPDYKLFKLEQNYRSTKNIVEAANSIIRINKENETLKVDFIYIDSTYLNDQNIELESIIALANNETCIIFENPHYSKATEIQWESVVASSKFNVTIDTYSFGLAFIRKEQVKEHFTIRV